MTSKRGHVEALKRHHARLAELIKEEEERLADPSPGTPTCGTESGYPCPACQRLCTLEREVYYTGDDMEEECEHCDARLYVDVVLMPIVVVAAVDPEACAYCGHLRADEHGPASPGIVRCTCLAADGGQR